ncbi:MAG TPA: hypothetical protein VIW69_14325, partial [Candidatus Elarobacter sp.]
EANGIDAEDLVDVPGQGVARMAEFKAFIACVTASLPAWQFRLTIAKLGEGKQKVVAVARATARASDFLKGGTPLLEAGAKSAPAAGRLPRAESVTL